MQEALAKQEPELQIDAGNFVDVRRWGDHAELMSPIMRSSVPVKGNARRYSSCAPRHTRQLEESTNQVPYC